MVKIQNWRDVEPKVAHVSAIVWAKLLTEADGPEGGEQAPRLSGYARHALQGRKTSDYHKHDNQEQVYYVLSGGGEVLFGEERHPVETGDAVYLPAGIHHQMFNDENDDWLEHHIISCKADGNGGTFMIQNWRNVPPSGDGSGAVRWRLLGQEDESEIGCLCGMRGVVREAVQPRGETVERTGEDGEWIYYVLENRGLLMSDGDTHEITEGDLFRITPGVQLKIRNPYEEWLSYLIVEA